MLIKQNHHIEIVLQQYENYLKNDFHTYKNHVYRIFNIACLFDTLSDNIDKYAIAGVFHDIGIWTHSFDYLEPSIELAQEYLVKIGKEEWIEEISLMIDNHHKMSRYSKKFDQTVEIFRKADWVDVSMGILLFGFESSDFKMIKKTFPTVGFHRFLIKQVFKYFLKHPFNPLPMFKR